MYFLYITPKNASLPSRYIDPTLIIIALLYTELGIFGFSTPCHGQYYFLFDA